MYLYNSFCYQDLDSVASSIASNVFMGDGYVVLSATANTSTIDIIAKHQNTNYSYTITPPECTKLGFDNSYTGYDMADAAVLSGYGLLILVAAFAARTARRGL